MKFYNALLILAATVSLTLGNSLEISDVEDETLAGNVLDEGFGGVELDQNQAPIEPPITPSYPTTTDDSSNIVPPTYPSSDNVQPNVDAIPATDAYAPAADETSGTTPDSTTTQPQEDVGEVSDDYGNTDALDQIDNANVEPSLDNANDEAATDNAENSDDYGENEGVDAVDAINTVDAVDAVDAADTLDQAGNDVADDSADALNVDDATSDDEADSSVGGTVAGGLAGVAALSSVGLFYYIKKSKYVGLESVRTQISLV